MTHERLGDDGAIARHLERALRDPIAAAERVAKTGVAGGLDAAAALIDELADDRNVQDAARRCPAATLKWLARQLREARPT